jgi:uncharacterized protein (TIGR02466 family)
MKLHFAVPVFTAEMEGFTAHREGIISRVRALRDGQPGMQRSNLRGWHSADNLHLDDDEHIAWLFRNIESFTTACATNSAGGRNPGEIIIEDAWANINPGGGWNMPHMHLPADWSGVCYISIEEDVTQIRGDGDLILIDPHPAGQRFGRGGTVNIRPSTGKIVLFPSYLMHMVAPHSGTSERISIAFNYRVRVEAAAGPGTL